MKHFCQPHPSERSKEAHSCVYLPSIGHYYSERRHAGPPRLLLLHYPLFLLQRMPTKPLDSSKEDDISFPSNHVHFSSMFEKTLFVSSAAIAFRQARFGMSWSSQSMSRTSRLAPTSVRKRADRAVLGSRIEPRELFMRQFRSELSGGRNVRSCDVAAHRTHTAAKSTPTRSGSPWPRHRR